MTPKQHKILPSVLAQIPLCGWTDAAFASGVKAAHVTTAEAATLYPEGINDIVAAFHAMIDEELQTRIAAKRNFRALRTRDKITFAVRARFEIMQPHREAVSRLMVWAVFPRNLRRSTQHLWQAADTIWHAAGDTSTDYNAYTKRGLLCAVMKATMIFWLADTSPDYAETWAFLDRRINDVMTLGKGIHIAKALELSDIVSFVKSRLAA
jgi:ubiquinone biosynthesis protein COQ9